MLSLTSYVLFIAAHSPCCSIKTATVKRAGVPPGFGARQQRRFGFLFPGSGAAAGKLTRFVASGLLGNTKREPVIVRVGSQHGWFRVIALQYANNFCVLGANLFGLGLAENRLNKRGDHLLPVLRKPK